MSEQENNMAEISAGEAMVAANVLPSPGAQLAAAREANGWTIEQVASHLNLAPRQIQAIESDNFAALPGLSIAKGFIRSYAKLLKIDSAPLIAAVPGESKNVTAGILPAAALSSPLGDTRLPSMADRPAISPTWYVVLVVLALLLGGLVWAQQAGVWHEMVESVSSWVHEKTNRDAASPASASASIADVAPTGEAKSESAGQASETLQNPGAAEMASANADASASALQTTTATATNVPAPAEAKPEAAPAMIAPVTPAAASENTKSESLVLKVTADSWVEVRSADNKIVFSHVIAAGKTEVIDINGPASVVIGNAAGVEATYRGAPLELKANTTSNVARLTLK